MGIIGWLDLALIAVVVITLATYLFRIIKQLQHVTFTLGTIIEVQAILVIARNIGVQAQEAIRGLEACWTNTAPLWDLQTTIDHASTIVNDLLTVRKSLGG